MPPPPSPAPPASACAYAWCAAHTPDLASAPPLSQSPTSLQSAHTPSLRRVRCRTLRTHSASIQSFALLLLPPVAVIIALNVSCVYALLFVCQIVLALCALELSWWQFRIRKRLLVPLAHSNEHLSRHDVAQLQLDAMHPQTRAISYLAHKLCCRHHAWLAALPIAAIVGSSVVAIVVASKHTIVDADTSALGWRVVVASVAVGAVSSTLCSCFAPTAQDAVVGVVYQSCFTVASLNTFVAHYSHYASDPTMLDSLYVVLVGACVLVVWRIVNSVDVLETALAIALDAFGLVFLTSAMMEVADFFQYKGVEKLADVVATFWIVICAAQIGHALLVRVRKRRWERCERCCVPLDTKQRLFAQSIAVDVVVAAASAAIGLAVASLAYPTHRFTNAWELSVLALAAVLSQVTRVGVATMRDVALVIDLQTPLTTSDDDSPDSDNETLGVGDKRRMELWNIGVVTLVSPYLVAAIVFHPYIKSLLNALAQAAMDTSIAIPTHGHRRQ